MHVTPNGAGAPRDPRLDKRKVALATAAVLVLFATNARAYPVYFIVDQDNSWLTQTTKLVGPALGGSKLSVPQQAAAGPYGEASDTTYFVGSMYVDIQPLSQPLSIQLMPGASVYSRAAYFGSGPSYAPHDYVFQDPPGAPYPVGVTPNADYGWTIPAIGQTAVQYGVRLDVGYAGDPSQPISNPELHNPHPSTPMPLLGNNFNLYGQTLSFSQGRQASLFAAPQGPFQNKTESLVGNLFVIFGTAGSDIGTWDDGTGPGPPNFPTLTIPVHSSWSFRVTNDFGGIDQFVGVTGQIVLFAPFGTDIPEPASMTLLGLGVAGLLGFAWAPAGAERDASIAFAANRKVKLLLGHSFE